ncbi:MAG TPA: OsmC family protein [Longimicrobiales bacterium]
MPDVRLEVRWTGAGLEFEGGPPGGPAAKVDGNGKTAVSPMQALLLSLAGCTAADVVDILTKMRVPLEGLELAVEGDRAAEAPRRYERIRIEYRVKVPGGAEEKVRRAVALSHEKYCSVLHTLRPDVVLETELVVV